MDVARKSFTHKEHEVERWLGLVTACSVVGLVQHAGEGGGAQAGQQLCGGEQSGVNGAGWCQAGAGSTAEKR